MRPLVLLLMATTLLASPTSQRILKPETRAQVSAWKSTAPELCYSGRRFGGKSWLGCAKGFAYAARYPGANVGICREERASMEGTTLRTLRTEVVPGPVWDRYWSE